MDVTERTDTLLEEIRDVHREHLAEYRRVTQESLDLQRRAVARQEQISLVYKRMASFAGLLVAVLLGLLLYLLVRWSPYLFR